MPDPVSLAHRKRRGLVLVVVLVALVLVASLAGATQHASFRAARAARLAWNGERALQGAGEAIAAEIAEWDAFAFAGMPIGGTRTRVAGTGSGGTAQVTVIRTAPLVAVIEATMTSQVAGSARAASRAASRVVALDVPPVATHAAVVAMGDVTVHDGAVLDGRDVALARDGCGTTRDTASSAALRASAVTVQGGATLHGASTEYGSDGVALARDRAVLRTMLDTVVPRIPASTPIAHGSPLPSANPWSPLQLLAADTAARQVVLAGSALHQGLVVVHGDLVVQGTLRIEGLLVVDGTVDTRMGTLEVLGGVVVQDERGALSYLGASTRVAWSPCAVRRALAAVARPSARPFAFWSER